MESWKKPALLAAALLLGGGALFFLLRPFSPPPAPVQEGSGPGGGAESRPAGRAAPPPQGEKVAEKRKNLGESASLEAIPAEWKPFLGGIKGKVVDQGGSPAPGLVVEVYGDWLPTLMSFAEQLFQGKKGPDLPSSGPLARTRTDEKGRFLLQGLFPGETALLRIAGEETNLLTLPLPEVPAPGEVVDLGEIRLPDFASLSGRVIDAETGEPVAGALVWTTSLPGIAAASGLLDLQGGEWVLVRPGIGSDLGLVRLPRPIRRLRTLLTLPSCRTGKDGTFLLRQVPPGRCALTVSKEGYLPLRRLSLPARPGRKRDMGELPLPRGNEMRILVKDSRGNPAAGVEVLAGAMPPLLPVAVMRPVGKTGPTGTLRAGGLPDGEIHLAAARPGDPWTLAGPFSPGEDGVITLEEGRDVRVYCVTKEGGAEKPLEPSGARLTSLLDQSPLSSRVKIQRGGSILLEGLSRGFYSLQVRAEGFGTRILTFHVPLPGKGKEGLKVLFKKACALEVFVRDGAGRPVEKARVFPLGQLATLGRVSSSFTARPVFTGPGGRAFLENLSPGWTPIAVQHPRAGNAMKTVELPARSPLVVVLAPGRIEGRVVPPPAPGGKSPREVLLVGGDSPVPVKMTRLTPEGTFLFPSVAPGRWELVLHEPLATLPVESMLFKFATANGRPRGITMSKTVKIGRGETKRVVFRLDRGKGPAGTIQGVLRLAGRPAPGYTVKAESGNKTRAARSGPAGAYRVSGIPPGPVNLEVLCQDPGFEGVTRVLSKKQVELPPGGNFKVDFDLLVGSIRGKVLGPSGRPLGGVMVEARWKGGRGEKIASKRVQAIAGTDGTFTMENVPLGSWEVTLRSEGFKSTEKVPAEITLPGQVARVTLQSLSVVSVQVRLDPPPDRGEFYQRYSLLPAGGPMKTPISGYVWRPEGRFRLQAPPGRYTLEVWIWGNKGKKWVARGTLTVPRKPKGPILVLLGPREDPVRDLPKYPVTGKLLGKDGKPAGPGRIHFNSTRAGPAPAGLAGLEFQVDVSGDGSFRGELPEGDFQWWALVRKGKKRVFLSSRSKTVHIPPGGVTGLALRQPG